MSQRINTDFLFADKRLEESEISINKAKGLFSLVPWKERLDEMPEEPECNPTISFFKNRHNHYIWASVVEENTFYLGAKFSEKEEYISAGGASFEESNEILNLYLDEKYDDMFRLMQQIERKNNKELFFPILKIFPKFKTFFKKLYGS